MQTNWFIKFKSKDKVMPNEVQSGIATLDIIMSGHLGGNEDLFKEIFNLHVHEEPRIADITFGRRICL